MLKQSDHFSTCKYVTTLINIQSVLSRKMEKILFDNFSSTNWAETLLLYLSDQAGFAVYMHAGSDHWILRVIQTNNTNI